MRIQPDENDRFMRKKIDKHEKKIENLEFKWLGSIGGVGVIIAGYLKSLFNA
jgi:hypothetical protein